MPNFDIQKLEAVNGKQLFYQLVVDGIAQLDLFENSLEQLHKNDFEKILSIMDNVANNQQLPGKKYHSLDTSKNDPLPTCEFKSGQLRVYALKLSGGKIVMFGGHKNNQKGDIKRLNFLKKACIAQLQIKYDDQKRITNQSNLLDFPNSK